MSEMSAKISLLIFVTISEARQTYIADIRSFLLKDWTLFRLA